jgi:hypothetical protein
VPAGGGERDDLQLAGLDRGVEEGVEVGEFEGEAAGVVLLLGGVGEADGLPAGGEVDLDPERAGDVGRGSGRSGRGGGRRGSRRGALCGR